MRECLFENLKVDVSKCSIRDMLLSQLWACDISFTFHSIVIWSCRTNNRRVHNKKKFSSESREMIISSAWPHLCVLPEICCVSPADVKILRIFDASQSSLIFIWKLKSLAITNRPGYTVRVSISEENLVKKLADSDRIRFRSWWAIDWDQCKLRMVCWGN